MKMTMNRWGFVCLLLALFILGFAIWTTPAKPMSQRYYWPVPLTVLAKGTKHTHVETRGQVAYAVNETDGDVHIKVTDPLNPTIFIICECTPKEPCAKPRKGSDIIVRGISRPDPEHGWWEIHPVESWRYATAGE